MAAMDVGRHAVETMTWKNWELAVFSHFSSSFKMETKVKGAKNLSRPAPNNPYYCLTDSLWYCFLTG